MKRSYLSISLSRGGRAPETLPSQTEKKETDGSIRVHVTHPGGAFALWIFKNSKDKWYSIHKSYAVLSVKELTREQYIERIETMCPPAVTNCTKCGTDLRSLPLTHLVRGNPKEAYCSRTCRGDKPESIPAERPNLPPVEKAPRPEKTAAPASSKPKVDKAGTTTGKINEFSLSKLRVITKDGCRPGSARTVSINLITDGMMYEEYIKIGGKKDHLVKLVADGKVEAK